MLFLNSLFILYMNDIVNKATIDIQLYTDDVTLFISHTNHEEASLHMNNNIENISEWAKDWFIKFNPAKTEALNFSRK